MAIKNKKGVFFTFMAILVVSVLVLSFSSDVYVTSKNKIPILKSRVKTADNYLRNLETSYLKTSLYTSSYNALKSIILYINQTDFLADENDLNSKFEEILLNGSINGENIKTKYNINLMEENTFIYRLEDIENMSQDVLHITTSFDKDNINTLIFQSNDTGPWQVGVNLTVNYSVDAGIALWNKTKTISIVISIFGFDDPLYLINPDVPYFHPIKETPFNDTEWNVSTLNEHIANATYRHESNESTEHSPSYLMRFYNNTSPSLCCGIESMINETLSDERYKSYVDYCFWSDECEGYGVWLYNITGITTPSYPFKLDAYHVAQYNMTKEAVIS
ncbi:MAG: hypothetical protein KKF74_01260 [Nanoarchaeota archaeon]|nr:hypothetical protein [Nanoarchaeota archaeon]